MSGLKIPEIGVTLTPYNTRMRVVMPTVEKAMWKVIFGGHFVNILTWIVSLHCEY